LSGGRFDRLIGVVQLYSMVVYRRFIKDAVCPNCNAEKVVELRGEWYRCEECGDEFGEYLHIVEDYSLEDEYRNY